MTSDVIDTGRPARQAGAMTNIGEVVQVVQVEPLVLAASPVAVTEEPAEAPVVAIR